jgi:1-acyl-sn-glycerol-3-phosphate acyltransferase
MSRLRIVDETFAQRWGRRAITIPAYLCLGTFTMAALPVAVPLALAIDAVRRTGQLATLRCVLGLTLYFGCEAGGLAASFLLWIASGVWAGGDHQRFQSWNLALQALWARAIFGGAIRVFSMRTEVSGTDSIGDGPIILFSRHASILDTLLPAVFVSHQHKLKLRYVLKRELLWDPCLDIVGQRTRNAFVRRASDDRDKEIALVRRLAGDLGTGEGVLIFPEGTRFTPAKRARVLERLSADQHQARLARMQSLRHVLPPRLGGPLALLETRPDVDVVFLAHVGFEGTANLNDVWTGKLVGRTISLHFWRVPSAAIPRDDAARSEWLDAQWARIDAWIDAHGPHDRSRVGPPGSRQEAPHPSDRLSA